MYEVDYNQLELFLDEYLARPCTNISADNMESLIFFTAYRLVECGDEDVVCYDSETLCLPRKNIDAYILAHFDLQDIQQVSFENHWSEKQCLFRIYCFEEDGDNIYFCNYIMPRGGKAKIVELSHVGDSVIHIEGYIANDNGGKKILTGDGGGVCGDFVAEVKLNKSDGGYVFRLRSLKIA